MPPESYWKDAYFEVDSNYFQRQISDAKQLLKFERGMTALDIGAGIGKAMVAMQNAGFESWGIEPSEPFLQKATELHSIARDRLQLASLEEAEFDSDSFNFITFGAVLEHLYNPAEAIERALGWLKPGGVVQIEVPSSNHLMPKFINLYFRLAGTNYVTNLSPMHPPYHLYAFTPDSFRALGDKIGYDIAYHYIEVASVRHVPHFIRPILRGWMSARKTGMQLTVWLRKPMA